MILLTFTPLDLMVDPDGDPSDQSLHYRQVTAFFNPTYMPSSSITTLFLTPPLTSCLIPRRYSAHGVTVNQRSTAVMTAPQQYYELYRGSR
jgi:hypothetical protein